MATRCPLPQHHEPFGLAKRQRPHERGVGQRKDGTVDADAEREAEAATIVKPGAESNCRTATRTLVRNCSSHRVSRIGGFSSQRRLHWQEPVGP